MHVSEKAEFEHPKGLIELMGAAAQEERKQILETSAAEAATIRSEAKALAARRREQALSQCDRELSEDVQRAAERAEAEAYMVELTAKDRITDEVLDAVRAKLSQMAGSPDFLPILEALLEELLPEAPENGVLLAPSAHVDAVRGWVEARQRGDLRVEGQPGLKDGVSVQDEGRSYRVTNTLAARLARQESALRKLCQVQLQPEGH